MKSAVPGQRTSQTPGLRLIIAYKLAKIPVMLALAIWLTVTPQGAYRFAESMAAELSAAGALWSRIGDWIQAHLSSRVITGGTVLAWLDAITTSVEAILLILRKPWAEWMVAFGLALLLPLEAISLERRPGPGKVVVLLINAAIVAYLSFRRLKNDPRPGRYRDPFRSP